jgi:hypothetical protein
MKQFPRNGTEVRPKSPNLLVSQRGAGNVAKLKHFQQRAIGVDNGNGVSKI